MANVEIFGWDINAEYIEDQSTYNENYYKLDPSMIGRNSDQIFINIHEPILCEYADDEDFFEYGIGEFDGCGNFVEVIHWQSPDRESIIQE